MASNPQHEPTMEEILASIRKIISEDSSEQPAAAAAAAPAPAAVPVEADVLELTQEVAVEAPLPPKPEPVRAAPPPKPADDIEFRTIEEPKPAPAAPAPAPAPAASGDDIFSDKTRKALDETFSKIPAAVEQPAPAPASVAAPAALNHPPGSSIEAVFERAIVAAFDPVLHQWMDHNKGDLLNAVKPLIREWMDEHFPALLEGAVRTEVERVVRARGGK
jgi:cell pole-organizing protein PopZ